jgi:two-component system cell cycle response regulator
MGALRAARIYHRGVDAARAPRYDRLISMEWREPPDPVFRDAAAAGERLVARIRLLAVGVIAAMQLAPGADRRADQATIVILLLALVAAGAFYFLLTRRYEPWIAFASSAGDVTFVTLGLLSLVLVGKPHAAVNSTSIFEIYFLTIGWSALRYDWRVCVFTGALALAQYGGLLLFVTSRYDLDSPAYAPYVDGMFYLNAQLGRIAFLAIATLLATLSVLRARQLRRLSATDRLTGLHNRGDFDERLDEEVSRSRRHNHTFTVAFVDIDGFKAFNDTHGHAGGDAALRTVAETCRRILRRSDVVARYGGDEFGLILPETAAAEAVRRMEDLRQAVASTLVLTGGAGGRMTVSIGVASWPADGVSASEVSGGADARLFEAKREGRDRVVGPRDGGDEAHELPAGA